MSQEKKTINEVLEQNPDYNREKSLAAAEQAMSVAKTVGFADGLTDLSKNNEANEIEKVVAAFHIGRLYADAKRNDAHALEVILSAL